MIRILGPRVTLAVSSAAAVIWITAVALSAFRGFDVTDEGYYLLSYRWWSENPRTFTGVQYLYGPVFELLNFDIPALRLFRLFTVVVTHVIFGYAFMRWLRTRRPDADPSRMWEWAGTATIVACGGMVYSWLPLSPGYNDVSLLTAMLATAIVLHAVVNPRTWWSLALGPVVVAGLLAKWSSSGLTFFVIAIVAAFLLRRDAIRLFALGLAGTAVTALAVHFFVIPFNTAIPAMIEVNRLVAARTNSPSALLALYGRTGWIMLQNLLRDHWVLLFAVFVSLFARTRWQQIAAVAFGLLGLALSVCAVVEHKGMNGGTTNLRWYPVALIAMLFAALIAMRLRDYLVIGLLLALPILQALGTGNSLHYMAINGFASWMAVIIYVYTGRPSRAPRWIVGAAACLATVLAVSIAVTANVKFPYRTTSYTTSSTMVPGLNLRLSQKTAHDYEALREQLKPYTEPTGRPIMGFDQLAGIVLLLGGKSVGEAWYAPKDRERTAASIKAECAERKLERQPILLFSRPVSETDIDALKSCGFDFAADYRLLEPSENALGLFVYVPAREALTSVGKS